VQGGIRGLVAEIVVMSKPVKPLEDYWQAVVKRR
jgi:hypothetical protein